MMGNAGAVRSSRENTATLRSKSLLHPALKHARKVAIATASVRMENAIANWDMLETIVVLKHAKITVTRTVLVEMVIVYVMSAITANSAKRHFARITAMVMGLVIPKLGVVIANRDGAVQAVMLGTNALTCAVTMVTAR